MAASQDLAGGDTAPGADEAGSSGGEGRGGGLFAPRRDPGPYPAFAVSMARGMRAAGSSPVTLAIAFAAVLALWGVFSWLGRPFEPPALTLVMALPPLHISLDAGEIFNSGYGGVAGLLVALGIMGLRAFVLGTLTLLVLQRLRDGRTNVRDAMRSLPPVALAIGLIYAIEFALVLGAPLLLGSLGPQFGQLAFLLVPVVGLLFLGFAPIVAAAEGVRAQEAMRRSWRAARLPGGRHMSLILGYYAFFYLLVQYASVTAPVSPATPGLFPWLMGLTATFVHAGVLGALAFRWLLVREQVPTGPAPPRDRARR